MVRLITLLQAAQDGDRVGSRRLADEHRLEAPLERRVLLDVRAVLVERRRTDGAQLTPREHRLEHVACGDGALGGTGADDRVQLVDEEDDLALGCCDLLQYGLEALLELAAVLRPCDERADVERPHALALEPFGYVPGDDALGEPFGDGCLAHAGLTDQHRVVLRAPRQHLDHAPDLLVTTDHRVELARLGERGQVAPVLLERLVRALRVLGGDALTAAHVLERLEQRLTWHEVEPEEQVLHRDELVVELPRLLERAVEGLAKCGAGLRRLLLTGHCRLLAEASLGLGAHARRIGAGALEQRPRQILLEQRNRQVIRGQLGVTESPPQLLGRGNRLTALDGQLVEVHRALPPRGARHRLQALAAGGCGGR